MGGGEGFPPGGWVELGRNPGILGIPSALLAAWGGFWPGGLRRVRRKKVLVRWVRGTLLREGLSVSLR